MTAYDIITIPAPALRKIAEPVENVNEEIQNQLLRMRESLEHAAGIGLAANQVNILNRVVLVNVAEANWEFGEVDKDGVLPITSKPHGEDNLRCMINPEIMWESGEKSVYEEGCLSIPGQYADVIRPAHVVVKYVDEKGEVVEAEVSGLESHCVQHEIDHLNGRLFIDYLSSLKRNMIMRKFKKAKL